MEISSKELAEKLNLSPATVSMVLNNKPGISQATRTLVLNAAREYGYSEKNPAATAQREIIHFIIYKKHGTVVADTPFFSQVIEGINRQCREENCDLHISYFYEYQDREKQLSELKALPQSGLLLLGTEIDPQDLRMFRDFGIPLVLLDCYDDTLDVDCVLINNVQGAYRATSYLLEMGHTKVGYLRSSVEISNFRERADGYYKALRHHGISTSHPYVHAVTPTAQEGYEELCALLDQKPETATAYFADNDIIAAAAIRAFRQKGFRVPEDISVIGFDDMPFCELIDPPLCTMQVGKQSLGAQAVSLLTDRIRTIRENREAHPRAIKIEISTLLIRRGSVLPLQTSEGEGTQEV